MAKIPFGILGPFIGKVGGVIGYIRLGTWCVRSMPAFYRDAKTPSQLRNRSKLARLMQFLCSMKPVIQSSFDVLNSDNPCRTEFNMAFAENFNTALLTTEHDTEILYHKIKLADGLLPALSGVDAYQMGNEIHISWSPTPNSISLSNSVADACPTDCLCLCAHNVATGQSIWNFHVATRRDAHTSFTLPATWQTNPVHLWAWFASSFSTSPSIYLGEFAQPSQKQKLLPPASRRPLLSGVAQSAEACIENIFHFPLYNLQSAFYNIKRIKVLPTPCLLRPSSLSQTAPDPPPKPPKIPLSHPQGNQFYLLRA